jgi:hypothetical protein
MPCGSRANGRGARPRFQSVANAPPAGCQPPAFAGTAPGKLPRNLVHRNPITYVEQLSYLLYLKLLDEAENQHSQAELLGITLDRPTLFPAQAKRYRWSECDGCRCTLDDLGEESCPACLRDDQHVMTLPKQPADLAEALLPMLRCAKSLRFVDPHFLRPDRGGTKPVLSSKHARVIQEIAAKLSVANRVPQSVEFHILGLEGDPNPQLAAFAHGMEAHLPKTWKAQVYLWREKLGGGRFHARYILTDVGGAGSEYGLDQGNSPGDVTDLYLLNEALLARRLADFSASGDAFELAAEPRAFTGIR